MVVIYVALMTLNALCCTVILLSGIQRKQAFYFPLALCNVALIFFHYFSMRLFLSTHVEEAITYSNLHLYTVLIGFTLYIFTFGTWSRFRYTRSLTLGFGGLALVLMAISFYSGIPLRYGDNAVLVPFSSPFDDPLHLLMGETTVLYPYMHAAYALICAFFGYHAIRLAVTTRSLSAFLLVATLVLQLVATWIGFQIDTLALNWVYLGGLPVSLLSLCVVIGISKTFKLNATILRQETLRRISLERLFAKLAALTNDSDTKQEGFYFSVLTLLAEYTKADYTLLGFFHPESKTVSTRLMLHHTVKVGNISYSYTHNACEQVRIHNALFTTDKLDDDYIAGAIKSDIDLAGYVGYPITDESGKTIGLIASFFNHNQRHMVNLRALQMVIDVFATRLTAELKREALALALKSMAYNDNISGLPNRARLLEKISQQQSMAEIESQDAMLLLLDIDHFSEVNRRHGYDVGDKVLHMIGTRLRAYGKSRYFVARNGGDEFAILYPKYIGTPQQALTAFWTELSGVLNGVYKINKRKIVLTFSAGAISFPSQLAPSFDVMGSAEHAARQAKQYGSASYTLFDPEYLLTLDKERSLDTALLRALKTVGELYMEYQPKVTIQGNVVGAEALIRWHHPEHGDIPPSEFIPVATQTGVIHQLGTWIINAVCRDIKRWLDAGLTVVPVSINVTVSQIEDPEFSDMLLMYLDKYAISPQLIDLELTESEWLVDKKGARKTLENLRLLGISISLDDFGTGYSSLSYLGELPLDTIKIDRTFVQSMHEPRTTELIKSIVAISKALTLNCVVEGTETYDEVKTLSTFGCEVFQGYHFSQPVPAHRFSRWLGFQSQVS